MATDNRVMQLLADSRLAILNRQGEEAMRLAVEARKIEPNNPETHKSIADIYMSNGQYEEAIKCYNIALKYDAMNGNRYFDVGYAYAVSEKLANALKHLAKAEELGCSHDKLSFLYNLLGIICCEIGRYDDSIINFDKALQLSGIDIEILQRKAVIYGLKKDVHSGLEMSNQIKLISPSDYKGYQVAFKLLIQADKLEIAERELHKARNYAKINMDYYLDCIKLELKKYEKNKDKKNLYKSLELIDEALETIEPSLMEVTEAYISAAEIYVQLEHADESLNCLNAALNPAYSYNNSFKVIIQDMQERELTEYDLEEMIAEDREKIYEKFGEYGFEEFVESNERNEDGSHDFLTEIEEVQEEKSHYRLDESVALEISEALTDQINKLFVSIYALKKDYDKVIVYAKRMQTSNNLNVVHAGKYAEINAYKENGDIAINAKYEELISYYRNAMIKNPSDVVAAGMRIQCYIDLGRYDDAENACKVLNADARDSLLKKIKEARQGGKTS